MGYAMGWLGHTRKVQLKNQLATDFQNPVKYRANRTFADVKEYCIFFTKEK